MSHKNQQNKLVKNLLPKFPQKFQKNQLCLHATFKKSPIKIYPKKISPLSLPQIFTKNNKRKKLLQWLKFNNKKFQSKNMKLQTEIPST